MAWTDGDKVATEPFEGAVEITAEQYREAIAGKLAGKLISLEGGFAIVDPPAPEPEPAPVPGDTPLELKRVASARLAIDGWDVTSIERSLGMSVAFVAAPDTVWVFFDQPQADLEYLVTPGEGVTKYADYIEVTKPGLDAVSLIVQRVM